MQCETINHHQSFFLMDPIDAISASHEIVDSSNIKYVSFKSNRHEPRLVNMPYQQQYIHMN